MIRVHTLCIDDQEWMDRLVITSVARPIDPPVTMLIPHWIIPAYVSPKRKNR